MIDNPNTKNPSAVNVRRRKSLPATLSTLRRRCSLVIQQQPPAVKASSSPQQCPKIKNNGGSSSSRSCCPPIAMASMRTQAFSDTSYDIAKSYPLGYYYSCRLVSKKLNKSNPYVGSFRHAPPTTFRDLRFQSTTSSLHYYGSGSHRVESNSISQALHLDTTAKENPFTKFWLQNKLCHEEDEECVTFQTKLLCSYLATLPCEEELTRKMDKNKRQYTKGHHRNRRRNKNFHDEYYNNNYYISGHLKGGSPCRDFINGTYSKANDNSDSSPTEESATVKIVSGIFSWFVQLDQSLPYTSDEHNVFPKVKNERQQRGCNQRRTRSESWPVDSSNVNCESSISSSDSDDNNHDDDDDDDNESTSSSSSTFTHDNYDTAHGSRTVTSDNYSSGHVRSSQQLPASTIITNNNNDDAIHTTSRYNMDTSCLSVLSTQAEAYYAQTSIASQLLEGSVMSEHYDFNNPDSNNNDRLSAATTASRLPRVVSREHLGNGAAPDSARIADYDTITQIDILRMTRLASRHLDVASIFQLPTVTYRSNNNKKQSKRNYQGQKEDIVSVGENDSNEDRHSQIVQKPAPSSTSAFPNRDRPEFSWMMVHKEVDESSSCCDDSSTIPSNDGSSSLIGHKITTTRTGGITDSYNTDDKQEELTDDDDQDVCVICLEHFVDGDRLRLLPCSHSFHVGCIDRWLSGSHSFDQCFTAGCPTCKKHPCVSNGVGHSSKQKKKKNAVKDKNAAQTQERCHHNSIAHKTSRTSNSEEDYHHLNYMEESTDGSVPSWAFARVGVALARESRKY